jgi:hypothetical protein
MNYNNLAQKTNWTAGTDKFPLVPFYLTNISIPGMNFSVPETGSRFGARINLASDTITYNSLSFDFLIDEDFEIYKTFYNYISQSINPEKGTFADTSFDLWVELNNSKSNKIMKFEFYNCRIESIGDIELDTTSDETEIVMNLGLKFDYFKILNDTMLSV